MTQYFIRPEKIHYPTVTRASHLKMREGIDPEIYAGVIELNPIMSNGLHRFQTVNRKSSQAVNHRYPNRIQPQSAARVFQGRGLNSKAESGIVMREADTYEMASGVAAPRTTLYAAEPSLAEATCRFDTDSQDTVTIEVSPTGTTLSYSFAKLRNRLQCVRTVHQTGWGITRISAFIESEAQLDGLLQADEYFEGRIRYFDQVKSHAMDCLDG